MAPELLELLIQQQYTLMVESTDAQARRTHCQEMYRLIRERSPEQRARMEARLPEPWRS